MQENVGGREREGRARGKNERYTEDVDTGRDDDESDPSEPARLHIPPLGSLQYVLYSRGLPTATSTTRYRIAACSWAVGGYALAEGRRRHGGRVLGYSTKARETEADMMDGERERPGD